MERDTLKAIIEALLFVSDKPIDLDKFKEVIGEEKSKIRDALYEMIEEYQSSTKGIEIVEVAGGYQMRTKSDFSEYIKNFLQMKPARLSRPAMETLAIIAYRQPITRSEIEYIRGVDSGGILRALLERKLIRIVGKKDVPGRPLLYGTTREFLELFGLSNIKDLPTLKDLDEINGESEILIEEREQVVPERNENNDNYRR